jgi:hypothetical protein
MKVIVEYEDGTRKELGEIEKLKGIQENARALVIQTDCILKQEDRKEIEQQIENKTGIPTLVADGRIKEIYVIPQ